MQALQLFQRACVSDRVANVRMGAGHTLSKLLLSSLFSNLSVLNKLMVFRMSYPGMQRSLDCT
jgi:hypothetical protein